MPGPGGGVNSGGFGGGSYAGTDGVFNIPELNFDSIINIYARVQNFFSEFWFSMNKPLFDAFADFIKNEPTGFISDWVDWFYEYYGDSFFIEFFNSFTLFDFIFGNLLLVFFLVIIKKLKL